MVIDALQQLTYENIKVGKLRSIASQGIHSGAKVLPDLPTFAEAGFDRL